MKRVLIAYFSHTGVTEKMAEYIAEGIRFGGHEAIVKKFDELSNASELEAYDGYVFGSPVDSADVPEPLKKFLALVGEVKLEGKLYGTFGPYTHDIGYRHDTYTPAIIFNALQNVYKMEPFELGPFNLNEATIDMTDGIKACHDYGKIFGEKLNG
jgi:flavodoxin